MKKHFYEFSLLFIALIFSNCAHQLPPGGGPIDKEPPEIVQIFPEQGTTNYKLNYVEVLFSEYINKGSLNNSIYISPFVDEEFEIKHSGKRIRINFLQKLRPNTTYVLTLGTDITDLRGNKLKDSYTLKFSTSDRIDDGSIKGKVFDPKPQGVMIYFYKLDKVGEHINYSLRKPDYVSQTSINGEYFITGLPYGIFRVIAIKDQMKNFLFDVNDDEVGIPFTDVVLNDSLKFVENIDFEMIKIDTIKPILTSVRQETNHHLRLNFNEPLSFDSIELDKIIVTDLNSDIQFKPISFFEKATNALTLVFINPLNQGTYKFIVNGIRDLANNEMDETNLTLEIENIPDSMYLNLELINCNFSRNIVDYFQPEIILKFDDFIDKNSLMQAITISDTFNRIMDFDLYSITGNSFKLQPKNLKQKEKYLLKIDFKNLRDIAGNKRDTLIYFTFETTSESDYGYISGDIKYVSSSDFFVLKVKEIQTLKDKYKVEIKGGNKYQIKNVRPGSYFLKLDFETSDRKIKNINTLIKPFIYYPDTIKVRARWPTTDVNFDLRKLPGY